MPVDHCEKSTIKPVLCCTGGKATVSSLTLGSLAVPPAVGYPWVAGLNFQTLLRCVCALLLAPNAPPFPCSGFGHCFCLSASSPVAVGKNRNATTACMAQIGFGLRDHHPARRTVVGSWLGPTPVALCWRFIHLFIPLFHCLWGTFGASCLPACI